MSVNYIFIARQGPVSPYGAHQVQAKMQITIQIRQQRRMIAKVNSKSKRFCYHSPLLTYLYCDLHLCLHLMSPIGRNRALSCNKNVIYSPCISRFYLKGLHVAPVVFEVYTVAPCISRLHSNSFYMAPVLFEVYKVAPCSSMWLHASLDLI